MQCLVLYPSMDRPNIYSFSDTNSPNIELTSNIFNFILVSKIMCAYWQNTVYVLSFVLSNCRTGGGKPPPSSYTLSARFPQSIISYSVFLPFYLLLQASATERIPCTTSSAIYSVDRVILDSTVLRIRSFTFI